MNTETVESLTDAIEELAGDRSFGFFLLFPPALLLLPFFYLMAFADSFDRFTPSECNELLNAEAHPDDRAALVELMKATQGNPSRGQLHKLHRKIEKQIQARNDHAALSRINAE